MSSSEVHPEIIRNSHRTGLAIFAVGAIFIILGRYSPSLIIEIVVYPIINSAYPLQGNFAAILSYFVALSVPTALLIWGTIKYYSACIKPDKVIDNEIIITCVSENNEFATEVFNYLYNDLAKHNQNEPVDAFQLSDDSLVIDRDEILIRPSSLVPKEVIRIILESLLDSDSSRYHSFQVIEFGNTFTIGKTLQIDSPQYMPVCEICGYFSPYKEEIYTHRLTHLRV